MLPSYALGKIYSPLVYGTFADKSKRVVIIDKCADRTLVNLETARSCSHTSIRPASTFCNLSWIDGVKNLILGECDLLVTIGPKVFTIANCAVVNSLPSNIALCLGNDFMRYEPCDFNVFTGLASSLIQNSPSKALI